MRRGATSGADHLVPHHPSFAGCFGCGRDRTGGLAGEIVARSARQVTMRFPVGESWQGAPEVAHGGLLAAALDEALGVVIWSLGGRYATARLETDYLAPVPLGSTLTVTARCIGIRGRKAYGEAEGSVAGPVVVCAAALFVELTDEA